MNSKKQAAKEKQQWKVKKQLQTFCWELGADDVHLFCEEELRMGC
jgi:hypothetical protein